jgi:predicted ATPase
MGEPAAALTHYTQGMALYAPQQHRATAFLYGDDAGVVCHIHAAWALWYLGYPAQGLARSQEAMTLAQQSAHPFSMGIALNWAAVFHQFCCEMRAAQERAEAALSLTRDQGFPLSMAHSAMLCGWALAHQGQDQDGIKQLHQGLQTLRATGAELLQPYFLALLAEAYRTIGQFEKGLAVLAEALALVDTRGERHYEAELYRLKGQLLLQLSGDNHTAAEACFQHAIRIAQNQSAKSWELRAATSLARLWQQQGKRQEAHDVLTPVYGWFTEGFDTADLQEAKTLLAELAR